MYSLIKIPVVVMIGVFIFGFLFLIFSIFKKDRRKIIFGFCVLTLAFGVWRSHEVMSWRPSEISPNFISGQKADFISAVVEEPDRRSDFAQYVLKNERFGRILVKTNHVDEIATP